MSRSTQEYLDAFAESVGMQQNQLPESLVALFYQQYLRMFPYGIPGPIDKQLPQDPNERSERIHAAVQSAEGALDLHTNIYTPGVFALSYQEAVTEIMGRIPQHADGTPHKYLLFGASTFESAEEWAQAVKMVDPTADLTVINLYPYRIRRGQQDFTFVQGDILHHPFLAGTFDGVFTNGLLPTLETSLPPDRRFMYLFHNASKLLRPDGGLVMVEQPSQGLPTLLPRFGLEMTQAKPAQQISLRRDVDNFLSLSLGRPVTQQQSRSMEYFHAKKVGKSIF